MITTEHDYDETEVFVCDRFVSCPCRLSLGSGVCRFEGTVPDRLGLVRLQAQIRVEIEDFRPDPSSF